VSLGDTLPGYLLIVAHWGWRLTSSAGASALDADTLGAILVRLVAECGTAEQLVYAGNVCKMWYSCSLNESLWRVLLVRRCGEGGEEMVDGLEASQRAGRDGVMSSRAQYIRSVTTQVLLWGQCASEEDATRGLTPRAPALFGHDGLRSVGVRQVSAGAGFSCLVMSTRANIQTHSLSIPHTHVCMISRAWLLLACLAAFDECAGTVGDV